jgi:hypothetical protein
MILRMQQADTEIDVRPGGTLIPTSRGSYILRLNTEAGSILTILKAPGRTSYVRFHKTRTAAQRTHARSLLKVRLVRRRRLSPVAGVARSVESQSRSLDTAAQRQRISVMQYCRDAPARWLQ